MPDAADNACAESRGLSDAAFRGAVATAAVAGLFVLIVAGLLLWNHARTVALDPRDPVRIVTLKTQLRERPKDEALKTGIRAADAALRREFFARQAFAERGAWLLAIGLIVFLASAKSASDLRKKPPMPTGAPPHRDERSKAAAWARHAVAAVATVTAFAFAVLAWSSLNALPRTALAAKPATSIPGDRGTPEGIGTPGVALTGYPSPEEMAAQWPRFRGPGGLGIATYTNAPMAWNGKTGEGVVWKTPVPLTAPNSPVVWGDRIFLSAAKKDRREVYCFGLNDGKLLWTGKVEGVPGSPAKPPEVMEATGYAASTVATDGRRVFAIFANGDLAAFDFGGRRIWAKNLGKPDNSYGHASSLLTWRDRLIVLMDQGMEDDDKSRLYAFDTATGDQVWATVREVGPTWATPIAIEAGGRQQIVTVAVPWLIAYAAETGKELWSADIMDGEIAPSPVFANGCVFVAQAYAYAAAVRADGTGDVTKTHVVWKAEDGLPDTCSPVTNGELLFLCTADGLITCYDAKTGEKAWEHETKPLMHFLASPTVVGDRVYVMSDKGVTIVFAAAREWKELARCELGEHAVASPAFLDGRIIFRGSKHLFCIGK